MKSKKLNKHLKKGEIWEDDTLYDVKNTRKRQSKKRTCRFKKHRDRDDDEY